MNGPRRLLLPLMWIVALSASAAEGPEILLEKLERRIELGETVSGTFEQKKTISVLPDPLQSHGRFHYERQSGLVWETLAPIANRLEFDDQGIRQSMEGQTVWEIDAQQPAVVTITRVISGVLAADWGALRNYFLLDGSIDQQGWRLHLIPNDPVLEGIISTISVSGDRTLSTMTLREANGDRTEIAFTVHGFPGQAR